MTIEIRGILGTVLPADLPPDLVALAQIDPGVERELKNPYFQEGVYDFLERELEALGLDFDSAWFGERPVTMNDAREMVNSVREDRGMDLLP